MKKCSTCGAGNLDEAKFCHKCGALIARERPESAEEAVTDYRRPSLDDLEFVETNLTTENPKTFKMTDKVSLRSTEKVQKPAKSTADSSLSSESETASEANLSSKRSSRAEIPKSRVTPAPAEPVFVDSLQSAGQQSSKGNRLAETGEVFIAEALANLDTGIDLDADVVKWQRNEADEVAPESLAVVIDRGGNQKNATSPRPAAKVEQKTKAELKAAAKAEAAEVAKVAKAKLAADKEAAAAKAKAESETRAKVMAEAKAEADAKARAEAEANARLKADSNGKQATNRESAHETDLIASAVQRPETEAFTSNKQHLATEKTPGASGKATDSTGNNENTDLARSRETQAERHHGDNPIFKREPVYLKPETYGPDAHQAQRKQADELASVAPTIECPHCGHQNPDYYSFCQVCKKKLYDYDEQTETTETASSGSGNVRIASSTNERVTDDDLFIPAYIDAKENVPTTHQTKQNKKAKKHRKERKRGYGWLVALILLIALIAAGIFAYFHFFGSKTASNVYQQYSEALAAENYDTAASLTASSNGHAWTADDVEQMVTNYAEAQIDLRALLAAQPEASELVQGSQLILEVDTEPSFLGLFPDYQVFVQAIDVALSVSNDYRDLAITTLAHDQQPITAGDPVILEPRENYIIVRLSENDETREIGIDLNYSLMADGVLPISLKQVENRIKADVESLTVGYPQEFKTTGFVIDGQDYTADIITLNGYVGQGFTVSIRGEYFGQEVNSAQQEIHLEDGTEVLVSLADDSELLTNLHNIEASQAENLANRTPAETAESWLQGFQNDFVDAINFRAPDMLAKYGADTEWYNNLSNWILNDVAVNGIYYNTATYDIVGVEQNENGQTVLMTTEHFDYTLGGVAAIQAQSKVYVLGDKDGQFTILSVETQDIAN